MRNNNNNHKKEKLRPIIVQFPSLKLPFLARFPSMMMPLIVLLFLVFLLVAVPTDIYAKYILLAVEDSGVKVAGFEHQVFICPEGELPETWAPGNQAVYSIQVSNQSANGISQTGQIYSIEVVTAGVLPLRCTLLEESEWEGNWNELEAFTESPQEKTHIFQTNEMQLPGEVPTEHVYKLAVSWENDYETEMTRQEFTESECIEMAPTAPETVGTEKIEIEDFIRINVNLEQMD